MAGTAFSSAGNRAWKNQSELIRLKGKRNLTAETEDNGEGNDVPNDSDLTPPKVGENQRLAVLAS